MYNRLTKKSQAEEVHEKMLEEQVKSDKLSVDGDESSEKMLDGVRDNEELIDTTEKQLDAGRDKLAEQTTEGQLNKTKGTYNALRQDKNESLDVRPLALLNAAHQKEREAEWVKANNAADRDTQYWDEYVSKELGKGPFKDAPSQLQNDKDRFSGLSTDPNALMDNVKVKKMVTASLMDADAMLFHIFYKAAGRNLTASEQSLVDGITRDKMTILSQVGGADHVDQRIAQLESLLHNREHDDQWEQMNAELTELIKQKQGPAATAPQGVPPAQPEQQLAEPLDPASYAKRHDRWTAESRGSAIPPVTR
jgi:hypothetical protein